MVILILMISYIWLIPSSWHKARQKQWKKTAGSRKNFRWFRACRHLDSLRRTNNRCKKISHRLAWLEFGEEKHAPGIESEVSHRLSEPSPQWFLFKQPMQTDRIDQIYWNVLNKWQLTQHLRMQFLLTRGKERPAWAVSSLKLFVTVLTDSILNSHLWDKVERSRSFTVIRNLNQTQGQWVASESVCLEGNSVSMWLLRRHKEQEVSASESVWIYIMARIEWKRQTEGKFIYLSAGVIVSSFLSEVFLLCVLCFSCRISCCISFLSVTHALHGAISAKAVAGAETISVHFHYWAHKSFQSASWFQKEMGRARQSYRWQGKMARQKGNEDAREREVKMRGRWSRSNGRHWKVPAAFSLLALLLQQGEQIKLVEWEREREIEQMQGRGRQVALSDWIVSCLMYFWLNP